MIYVVYVLGGMAIYGLGVVSVYVACADDPEFYQQFDKRVQNLRKFME